MVSQVHPDCINASNPYHECSDFCLRRIAERKSSSASAAPKLTAAYADLPKEFGKQQQQKKRVDPAQRFSEEQAEEEEDSKDAEQAPVNIFLRPVEEEEEEDEEREGREEGRGGERGRGEAWDYAEQKGAREEGKGGERETGEGLELVQQEGEREEGGPEGRSLVPVNDAPSYENMSERQKKLFELRLKLNEARKANHTAVVAEKKKEKVREEPQESRGMSKAKWYEEKKQRMGKVLEAHGLDMDRAHMLDTQEAAEQKYKSWEKKEAAFGWDVFNQKSLYKAYKKRAVNVPVDMVEYQKQKETDPDFYRDGSCLEYGKAPEIPEENVDRMVAELQDRGKKRKEFSRRRRHHEEKDVDSINERNEHFNRKIERAFGKYTVEIKNNLERGTALPD